MQNATTAGAIWTDPVPEPKVSKDCTDDTCTTKQPLSLDAEEVEERLLPWNW